MYLDEKTETHSVSLFVRTRIYPLTVDGVPSRFFSTKASQTSDEDVVTALVTVLLYIKQCLKEFEHF